MENILKLLYDMPNGTTHGPDSAFVQMARTKVEKMDLLSATMTDEQKQLLDAYFNADSQIENIIQFDRFRYAFHLGAQLMAELIEGRDEVL